MSDNKRALTIKDASDHVALFIPEIENNIFPSLYQKNDGKAIGTMMEKAFIESLKKAGFTFSTEPNSGGDIDLVDINTEIKTTSSLQPQSSAPYRDSYQKVYGLGYNIILFSYTKLDDSEIKAARFKIDEAIFLPKELTADFSLTTIINEELKAGASEEEILELLIECGLPGDKEFSLRPLAKKILAHPPLTGLLTISNALQWRLQYKRAIKAAKKLEDDKNLFAKSLK